MSGIQLGLHVRIKIINSFIIWHHCCLYRKALTARNMLEKLNEVLLCK